MIKIINDFKNIKKYVFLIAITKMTDLKLINLKFLLKVLSFDSTNHCY